MALTDAASAVVVASDNEEQPADSKPGWGFGYWKGGVAKDHFYDFERMLLGHYDEAKGDGKCGFKTSGSKAINAATRWNMRLNDALLCLWVQCGCRYKIPQHCRGCPRDLVFLYHLGVAPLQGYPRDLVFFGASSTCIVWLKIGRGHEGSIRRHFGSTRLLSEYTGRLS